MKTRTKKKKRKTRIWKEMFVRVFVSLTLGFNVFISQDELDEIDPAAILPSRRTRGAKVDYTSKEALEKAGLKPEHEDDDEDSYVHESHDDSMEN